MVLQGFTGFTCLPAVLSLSHWYRPCCEVARGNEHATMKTQWPTANDSLWRHIRCLEIHHATWAWTQNWHSSNVTAKLQQKNNQSVFVGRLAEIIKQHLLLCSMSSNLWVALPPPLHPMLKKARSKNRKLCNAAQDSINFGRGGGGRGKSGGAGGPSVA